MYCCYSNMRVGYQTLSNKYIYTAKKDKKNERKIAFSMVISQCFIV